VIGLGRPFPYISNLSLSLGVLLRDPESGTEVIARVKVPKELLGRFLPLGEAAARAARARSWERALEQLAGGYRRTLADQAASRQAASRAA
jgi:polyphosphate kinase